MLDVAVGYNKFSFLGNEFLTWLWYMTQYEEESLQKIGASFTEISVGQRIVFENHDENSLEKITIKGNEPSFEEGLVALTKGSLITELQLYCKEGAHEFTFSIKGESFGLSGVKIPSSGSVNFPENMDGAILERLYLFEKTTSFIMAVFSSFLKKRVSSDWETTILPAMKKQLKR